MFNNKPKQPKTTQNKAAKYNELNRDFGVIIELKNNVYHATLVSNKNILPNLKTNFKLTTFENKVYVVISEFTKENIFEIQNECASKIKLINQIKFDSQAPSKHFEEDLEEHQVLIKKLSDLLKIDPTNWIASTKKLNKFLQLIGLEVRIQSKNFNINELFNLKNNKTLM
jgi:hypothetical protein